MRHTPWLLAALIFALAMAPLLHAGENHRHLWLASVATLVAAEGMDVASSRGGVEANPIMKHGGVAIKVSAVGAVVLIEWLATRHHPSKVPAIVNFAGAGALTGVAVRNWRIK
jgi:hypothetical protein